MENIIHIEDLLVCYDNTKVLDNISLDIKEKEFIGIMGPNGGGKTTLLKAILGLIKPTSGKVLIYNKPSYNITGVIGYVPQFAKMDKKFPVSVLEVVMMGLLKSGIHPFFKYTKEMKDLAYKKLKKVGIENLAHKQISELSGGQFQRLLIARALATDPKILLLDEPTASVDAKSKEQIYNLLEELSHDITVILVTHDLFAISTKVKKIACLNQKLVYHGDPSLNENIVESLYGCPVDLIAHGVPHRVLKQHKGED